MQDVSKNIKVLHNLLKVPKDVRLNSTPFFIMKIPNKSELQPIALNHSSEILEIL